MYYDVHSKFDVFFAIWAGDGQLASIQMDVDGNDVPMTGDPDAPMTGKLGAGVELEGRDLNLNAVLIRVNEMSSKASLTLKLFQQFSVNEQPFPFNAKELHIVKRNFKEGENVIDKAVGISLV